MRPSEVTCPHCKAGPGYGCTVMENRKPRPLRFSEFHPSRIELAAGQQLLEPEDRFANADAAIRAVAAYRRSTKGVSNG